MDDGSSKALTIFKLSWLLDCASVEKITALELRICIELALHYASMTDSAEKFDKTHQLIVFPSQSALARTLKVSRQGVQKAIRRLIKQRKVLLLTKQGGKGRKRNNEYSLIKRSSEGSVSSGKTKRNKRSSACRQNATTGVAVIPYKDKQRASLRPVGAAASRAAIASELFLRLCRNERLERLTEELRRLKFHSEDYTTLYESASDLIKDTNTGILVTTILLVLSSYSDVEALLDKTEYLKKTVTKRRAYLAKRVRTYVSDSLGDEGLSDREIVHYLQQRLEDRLKGRKWSKPIRYERDMTGS